MHSFHASYEWFSRRWRIERLNTLYKKGCLIHQVLDYRLYTQGH
ncbi:hypothetical protein SAMN05421736_105155 [Evansella caseinilytica]|uniref:Uncharacterized protein n=1 Tax=Evansella caseinilytica TaxID=1503961 RepID=A0A1H3PQV5_9BACI|nr:hypothetical protein SAMN05421736_105155 [Evansella caseinilytica]